MHRCINLCKALKNPSAPCSLLPTPYSLFPVPCSLFPLVVILIPI
ncbi:MULTISPECIES: hypothetical protein [Moorena]|nr:MULTISPECIES: hypothetical protein [Moorena]